MEDVILVSYAEMSLKSEPVRRALERMLSKHVKFMLGKAGFKEASIRMLRGRLIIENVGDVFSAAEISSRVFGVSACMPALKASVELAEIVEKSVRYGLQLIRPYETFAVRARRVNKHPFTSREVEVKVGAEILSRFEGKGVKVDLESPDKTIYIEVREGSSYIYSKKYRGPAGLPFGSQGKLVSLLSGGIDSPVAAWLMMKRGAHVIPLFLDMQPYTGEDYRVKAIDVSRKLREYVPVKNYYLLIAPFGEVSRNIIEKCPRKFTCVLCKRMMYRVACAVAEMEGASGVVTGESLGQVASQTLQNLRVLSEASTLPIYRPLIGFDKMESQSLAQKIGTYEISIREAHGCSIVPARPATAATLDKVKEMEEALDLEKIVKHTIDGLERIPL